MDMKLPDEHIAKVAKALSDRTRLRILDEIAKGKSITCGEAEKIAGLSQPTVSHHLKILIQAGLLNTRKNGRHVIISVNKKALDDLGRLISDWTKK